MKNVQPAENKSPVSYWGRIVSIAMVSAMRSGMNPALFVPGWVERMKSGIDLPFFVPGIKKAKVHDAGKRETWLGRFLVRSLIKNA